MKIINIKIKKLFTVSVSEILFRIFEKFTKQKELFFYCIGIKHVIPKARTQFPKKNLFFTQIISKEKRKKIISEFSDLEKIFRDADQVLKGKVTLLGQNMYIPFGDAWRIDQASKRKWPFVFYSKIKNHKAVGDLDIKHVWEINRHQYLIPLAKAFWLTGDEKYAQKIFSVICDWINANPYNKGVNWTSSLEHAVRLFSWIWSLNLCRDSIFYKKFIEKITNSIYEQAFYIDRHLSLFSSPYNHLVGEAAALSIVGALFPEFEDADKWEVLGWQILESEIEKQFHADGMTVEQAFFYHHFTLGFYLQVILLKKINGKNISENVLNRLEKALEFSKFLSKPDGTLPMMGDIDNARSIYFSLDHSWNFSAFYALGAVLYNRPDLKPQNQIIPEEILWILDEKDLDTFLAMRSEFPSETSFFFKDSGYCVIRDSWKKNGHYLCFDCGEIAHGLSAVSIPSAAHGHADGLSFELSAFGESFIVDSGFFTYFGNIDWHKHFRCEEAHNTVHIKGYRQAEYCGRLKWQNVKNSKYDNWKNSKDFIYCSGKIVYEHGIVHKRSIYFEKNYFWIVSDEIKKSRDGLSVESYLHFHPDVNILVDTKKMEIVAEKNRHSLFIKLMGYGDITAERGGEKPSSGWVCSGYGMKKSAWRLIISWPPEAMNSPFFLIVPYKKDSDKITVFHEGQNINHVNLKINDKRFGIYRKPGHSVLCKRG